MLKFFVTLIDSATKESLQVDETSLFETFGSLKVRNF